MNKTLTRNLLVIQALSWIIGGGLPAQDMPLEEVLVEGQGWELVGEGYKFTEGPACDPSGRLYFTDPPGNTIIVSAKMANRRCSQKMPDTLAE